VYRFETRSYTTSAVDPDDEEVFYLWDWGESMGSWDQLPRESGNTVIGIHTWRDLGEHEVRAKAMDVWGWESDWSDPLLVTVWRRFGAPYFPDDHEALEVSTQGASPTRTETEVSPSSPDDQEFDEPETMVQ